MKKQTTALLIAVALTIAIIGIAITNQKDSASKNPVVELTTSYGTIEIELYRDKAPITVKNFLGNVERGHYNGMIFHRVIKGFMIQGGGFKPGMKQISPAGTIRNEADNGLKNLAGTIAMARTPEPHSAGAQFFINTNNNANLNFTSKTHLGWGYAVFGKVTKGMNTVRRIESALTRMYRGYGNVPIKDIAIIKVAILHK